MPRRCLSTHGRKALTAFCGEEIGAEIWECFTPQYTPPHGSWLNQAEIEIGLFARQGLGKRRLPDLATLRREAGAWSRRVNRDQIRIDWHFDRKAARRTFRLQKTIYQAVRELGYGEALFHCRIYRFANVAAQIPFGRLSRIRRPGISPCAGVRSMAAGRSPD